jgi:hypothetical protein
VIIRSDSIGVDSEAEKGRASTESRESSIYKQDYEQDVGELVVAPMFQIVRSPDGDGDMLSFSRDDSEKRGNFGFSEPEDNSDFHNVSLKSPAIRK